MNIKEDHFVSIIVQSIFVLFSRKILISCNTASRIQTCSNTYLLNLCSIHARCTLNTLNSRQKVAPTKQMTTINEKEAPITKERGRLMRRGLKSTLSSHIFFINLQVQLSYYVNLFIFEILESKGSMLMEESASLYLTPLLQLSSRERVAGESIFFLMSRMVRRTLTMRRVRNYMKIMIFWQFCRMVSAIGFIIKSNQNMSQLLNYCLFYKTIFFLLFLAGLKQFWHSLQFSNLNLIINALLQELQRSCNIIMIVEATPPHSLRGIIIPKLYQCLRIRQQKRELNNIHNKDKKSIHGGMNPPFKSFSSLTNDTRDTRNLHGQRECQDLGFQRGVAKVKKPIAKIKSRKIENKLGLARIECQSQIVRYRIPMQALSMGDAFDWMMQMSCSLKISKNAYFRAVLILLRSCKLQPSLRGTKFRQYICAALSIGWKFEYSPSKALQQICKRNLGYCQKTQIIQAQGYLLNLLGWKVPVQLMLQEMLNRLLPAGIEALMPAHRLGDRSYIVRGGWEEQKMRASEVCKKLEIEIVYLVDFLLLIRAQHWLNNMNFTEPILIALYTVLSITLGDLSLNQFVLWPSFESFVRFHTPQQDLHTLHLQITHCFNYYKISQILARIPLRLDLQTLGRRKYQQLYIRQTDPY